MEKLGKFLRDVFAFKEIWGELKSDGELSHQEAKLGKKGTLILALFFVTIMLFFFIADPFTGSILAIPLGICTLIPALKFRAADKILKRYEQTYCKNCKTPLTIDENTIFNQTKKLMHLHSYKTGEEATGNLLVKSEGDHYIVSEEKMAAHKSFYVNAVIGEFTCKCPKCNSSNTGTVELEVIDYTDEAIKKALGEHFADLQSSK